METNIKIELGKFYTDGHGWYECVGLSETDDVIIFDAIIVGDDGGLTIYGNLAYMGDDISKFEETSMDKYEAAYNRAITMAINKDVVERTQENVDKVSHDYASFISSLSRFSHAARDYFDVNIKNERNNIVFDDAVFCKDEVLITYMDEDTNNSYYKAVSMDEFAEYVATRNAYLNWE